MCVCVLQFIRSFVCCCFSTKNEKQREKNAKHYSPINHPHKLKRNNEQREIENRSGGYKVA